MSKRQSFSIEPFNDTSDENNVFHYRGIAPLPPPAANPSRHTYIDPRGSSVYRVSLDYFDPTGVQELRRRSLTGNGALDLRQALNSMPMPEVVESRRELANVASHATLVGGEQGKLAPPEKSRLTSISQDTLDTLSSEDVKEVPFDFEKSLQSFMNQRADADIPSRELGVMFQNLTVLGLGATVSYQSTVGSIFNPLTIIGGIQAKIHPPVREILSGIEGVVSPGEMLLVLGSPGSGCSTMLKTLTNQRKEYYAVKGDVHYDSITPEELAKHYRGDVQYCPEDDTHFPSLTVDQTLKFAATTRTPQNRVHQTRSQYQDLFTEVLTTVFGLRHARKTPVGDAMIRGVSGGEKKRVSIAETLASRALITAWDNSTRGLDASTALEFVRALRIATDSCRLSTIVSIYQAGESLYQHFDKVCVLYAGKMAYYGPADRAKEYFIKMGYQPANRQTTADFLVAVTDPNARIPRNGITTLPRTAQEFARYFWKSSMGQLNRREIERYRQSFVGQPQRALAYKLSAQRERANHARKGSAYTISIPMQVRAVMLRRIQILRGNGIVLAINLFLYIFQGVMTGTVFIRLPVDTSAFYSRGGVLFFSILFSALTAMSEIPALYQQRPIVLRHEKAALYHPFIEALALTLVDIPITAAINSVYVLLVYFAVGLQRTASQFFIFLLVTITLAFTMKTVFRTLAAAFSSEAVAQTCSGVILLPLALYTGFSTPKPSMIGALRWISDINPVFYGFSVVMTNEFHTINAPCSTLIPSGPGYENITLENQVCTTVGSIPGQSSVNGDLFVDLSYGFKYSQLWRNYAIVVAFGLAFLVLLLVFTELNTSSYYETLVTQFVRRSHAKLGAKKDDEEENHEISMDIIRNGSMARGEPAVSYLASSDIFSWLGINYIVAVSGGERQLLDNIAGYVAPGKLTALMGESGAGKTTLLNVLAQRTTSGVVTGDRLVNGQRLPADFQSQTGYCQQMDTHVPTDTVREACLFSANLRQPPGIPLAEKELYVDKCLKMCGLENYADAIVGSLSIEHRKRTTIAVELAAKPKLLLFLDEPTSGLDSQSSWAILQCLRDLADAGQAILCTIHQPSAELFQVFDRLLLLKKGGKTVYFGDIGDRATTLIDYFERNGARDCGPDENPAEFMLDVIGAGATATSTQDWHDIWKNAPEAIQVQREIERIHNAGQAAGAVQETIHSEFATPWVTQLISLCKRDFIAHWRDPTYIVAKMALNLVAGVFIGFTYFKAPNSQQGTQNKVFAMFMSTMLSVALSNQLQVYFIKMRNVYEIRERPSRMYSWTALVTSQVLSELPWNILGSSLYFLTWYWTVGFDTSRAPYTFIMLGIIFPLYYTTIAQAIASMAGTAEIAGLLFTLLFSFVLTFNGVLQPFSKLGWWQWMYRLSPFTYLIEGLVGQAIGNQEVTCAAVEYVSITPPSGQTCAQYMQAFISAAGGYLLNPDDSSNCNFCSISSTNDFLAPSFNIFYHHRWRNMAFMAAFTTFNFVCIYLFTYIFRIRPSRL